jgi:hypothetical protein
MKNNLKLFVGGCILCGIFTFLGSAIGNAFSHNALFAGAIIGGVLGLVLMTLIFTSLKILNRNSVLPTIVWGSLCFGTASVFAVNNLNSPVIPLLSIFLVGFGCVIGNSFKLKKRQSKQLYVPIISFILIIPALYFVIGCIVKYEMGFSNSFTLLDWLVGSSSASQMFNLVSPFVFIGGTVLSILLNISVKSTPGNEKASLFRNALQLSKLNLLLSITAMLLLFSLTVYLFVENLDLRF